ncbi:hypothetical protein J2Z60_001127 [Lactobacillus colini]|uniref:Uncharacterized protein n=1 Tax=Lactobacillus colini TaxID=1819254 RepID=A0ABS4ME40_9LACO|nr:hypothetical protein [Lactobacillus colini]MBP2057952.1 hypothetical protein [Lactobacillus colini]
MYDYRTDIINLMRSTQDNDLSLKQSMVALKLIVKMFDNSVIEDKELLKQDKQTKKKLERLLANKPKTKVKFIKDSKTVNNKNTGKKRKKSSQDNTLYVPQIDFNLNKKLVGVVCAQEGVSQDAYKVIVAHNGKVKLLTNEDQQTIPQAVKGLDIVVAFKQDTSRGILDILDSLHAKRAFQYALADSNIQLDIEKALYRSDNQLGVLDSNDLKYPSANLKSLLLASQTQIKDNN